MALHFDFTDMIARLGREEFDRITDHPTEGGEKWHPITDSLIWATMIVGIGQITEKTVDEFARRLAAYQAIDGGMILREGGRIHITREDVERHIGLRTNVTKESAATFNAKIARAAIEAGERAQRRQSQSAWAAIAQTVEKAKVADEA